MGCSPSAVQTQSWVGGRTVSSPALVRRQYLRCLSGVWCRSLRTWTEPTSSALTQAAQSTAHVLAFNISGRDPFTGTAIPAATTTSVGAAPIIFITQRTGRVGQRDQRQRCHSSTPRFGGSNCDASAFGVSAAPIQVYLREPLSGTMNTTEYTVFRYKGLFRAHSQETGVAAAKPARQALYSRRKSSSLHRNTGEEVKFVLNSGTNFGTDGIGLYVFSYGKHFNHRRQRQLCLPHLERN